jgi:hypothetical protein
VSKRMSRKGIVTAAASVRYMSSSRWLRESRHRTLRRPKINQEFHNSQCVFIYIYLHLNQNKRTVLCIK